MFQAQSANWEETQEKMSQLVFPARGLLVCSISDCLMDSRFFLPFRQSYAHRLQTSDGVVQPSRWETVQSPTRETAATQLRMLSMRTKRYGPRVQHCSDTWALTPLLGHWIQDCPTNNDRDFDNKPRIKRTTGIPRSFLKSVDSPSGQLSSGVMVTPEGGFVVAQPDS